MAHRPFVMWPAKVLRTLAADVTEVTDETRALWDEMIEAMDAMPGVGLAAPQLGVSFIGNFCDVCGGGAQHLGGPHNKWSMGHDASGVWRLAFTSLRAPIRVLAFAFCA